MKKIVSITLLLFSIIGISQNEIKLKLLEESKNNSKNIGIYFELGNLFANENKPDSSIIFYNTFSEKLSVKFLSVNELNNKYPAISNSTGSCGMLTKVSCARNYLVEVINIQKSKLAQIIIQKESDIKRKENAASLSVEKTKKAEEQYNNGVLNYDACQFASKTFSENPQDAFANYVKARCLMDQGKNDEAKPLFEFALNKGQNVNKCYEYLGEMTAGNIKSLLSRVRTYGSLEKVQEVNSILGGGGQSSEELKIARTYYEKSLEADNKNSVVLFNLGAIEEILNNTIKANNYYEKACSIDNDYCGEKSYTPAELTFFNSLNLEGKWYQVIITDNGSQYSTRGFTLVKNRKFEDDQQAYIWAQFGVNDPQYGKAFFERGVLRAPASNFYYNKKKGQFEFKAVDGTATFKRQQK